MTVAELQAALQAAVDRGLPPETTVVVDREGWYWVLDEVQDPSDENEGCELWFTLFSHQEADSRLTPGGMPS